MVKKRNTELDRKERKLKKEKKFKKSGLADGKEITGEGKGTYRKREKKLQERGKERIGEGKRSFRRGERKLVQGEGK